MPSFVLDPALDVDPTLANLYNLLAASIHRHNLIGLLGFDAIIMNQEKLDPYSKFFTPEVCGREWQLVCKGPIRPEQILGTALRGIEMGKIGVGKLENLLENQEKDTKRLENAVRRICRVLGVEVGGVFGESGGKAGGKRKSLNTEV